MSLAPGFLAIAAGLRLAVAAPSRDARWGAALPARAIGGRPDDGAPTSRDIQCERTNAGVFIVDDHRSTAVGVATDIEHRAAREPPGQAAGSVRRVSWKGWRRVRRQAQLDPGFTDELVAAVPGGDRLRECIQCGACSAVCPLSAYMEYTPRRLIAMTRAGMKDDVLSSTSIWVCASCYACTSVCPKEIPITELVYALKRMSVREKMYPRRFSTPTLAREFEGSVDRFGRNTESRLAIRLYLRTRPTQCG